MKQSDRNTEILKWSIWLIFAKENKKRYCFVWFGCSCSWHRSQLSLSIVWPNQQTYTIRLAICAVNAEQKKSDDEKKMRKKEEGEKRYNDSALSYQLFSHFVHIWIERHATCCMHCAIVRTKRRVHLKRNRIVFTQNSNIKIKEEMR